MRKIMGLFAFLACVCAASAVSAHPASQVNVTFDPVTKMLVAVITHQVGDPVKHYIDKVDVTLNGKAVLAHVISRQDNNVSQTVTYLIPDAAQGDALAVNTNCNKGGKLKKQIKVSVKGL